MLLHLLNGIDDGSRQLPRGVYIYDSAYTSGRDYPAAMLQNGNAIRVSPDDAATIAKAQYGNCVRSISSTGVITQNKLTAGSTLTVLDSAGASISIVGT